MAHNPADRARERRLLTSRREDDNERQLLKACPDARNPFLLPIIRGSGSAIRQDELIGLRWENIDLNRRITYLPHSKRLAGLVFAFQKKEGKPPKAVPVRVKASDLSKSIKRPWP